MLELVASASDISDFETRSEELFRNRRLTDPRPPRVHITYDLESNGAIEKSSIPFVIGVLADLSSSVSNQPLEDRQFLAINAGNFDSLLARFQPEVHMDVPNYLMASSSVTLKFSTMADFEPAGIAAQMPPLQELLDLRRQLIALLIRLDQQPALDAQIERASQTKSFAEALAD